MRVDAACQEIHGKPATPWEALDTPAAPTNYTKRYEEQSMSTAKRGGNVGVSAGLGSSEVGADRQIIAYICA
jgi:hypothetical protein